MPLFIPDDDVTAMAEELARLTKSRSKTEAVRRALRHAGARPGERAGARPACQDS